MNFSTEQLTQILKKSLDKAHEKLVFLGDKGTLEVHGEHVTDISTEGDIGVSDSLIEFFQKEKVPAVLDSEESGTVKLIENPIYRIGSDDVDGTFNFFRGEGMLPYCTIITIFDSMEPYFGDALVAGIIEHNSGRVWHAVRGGGCFLNDVRVKSSGTKAINRKTLVAVDLYASKDVSVFSGISSKVWLKDFGSAGFHLAGVSSGMFDGYLSADNKAYELGAGLLIKEAGGYLMNWDGTPLDEVRYNPKTSYSVIAAATRELGELLFAGIKK
ncbi:MAG: inositol monophosphatase family protein [Candidatus Nealsonbacteria bacterium]